MKTLLSILTLFLSINLLAQTHFLGLDVGINRTNINGNSPFNNSDNRYGLNYGVNYNFHLNEHFLLGSGVNYAQKGFKVDAIFTDENGEVTGEDTYTISYDYLTIPLKIGYTSGRKFAGFANAGIVPSILLRSELNGPGQVSTDQTDVVTRFDLVGLAELGMSFELNTSLLLSSTISFQQGFRSLTNEEYFAESKMRNYSYGLLLSLMYKLNTVNTE